MTDEQAARTTVAAADQNTYTEYTGLRCFSLTSCVAIGGSIDLKSGTETLTAALWNGTTFTDLKAPQPSRTHDATFSALSCVSERSCAVIGTAYTNSADTNSLGFAEVWNGKTWTVTKWSGPKGNTAALFGVSCTSAVRCIAVGVYGTSTSSAPGALAWGGSKWTVLKVPSAGRAALFFSVSCPVNGKCVAAGAAGKMNTSNVPATPIAGYWNGRAWKYGPMFPSAAA